MDLSIVIVNWNTRQLLLDCLASIPAGVGHLSHEIFVVDNASGDDSVARVRQEHPGVIVIENGENLGFAVANNRAFRRMRGDFALLLNTDTVLTEDSLLKLHRFLVAHPEAGMACGQLLNRDGSKQNSIANFPTLPSLLINETLLRLLFPGRYPSKRREYAAPIEIESGIGACLMVRKAAMDEVGLLDERYFFFMEETDWALAMRKAGWKSFFVPEARIYHLQGQSAGARVGARIMFYRARYQYFRKWHPRLFPLYAAAILVRLSGDLLLNLAANLLTLGLVPSLRLKLERYGGLMLWHLKGCP